VEEIREKNDDQPLDVVIRTDPASGDLKEGEPITMYVSDGPTPSELPPLAGQRIEVAMQALSELDLKLTVAGQEPNETVPAGTILSFTVAGQQVPERSMVDKGSTVNAVVSSGPAPRTIPAIAGMAPADAEAALTALGLVPARGEDVFADGVPAGQVATSTPAPGTSVARDSTVTYQVSKGPNLVQVPVLNMMNLQQATAALAAAGLRVGAVTGDPNRAVVIASPPAGTSVPRGTAIALTFF
jgi:serine/threonine-protein kinase